MGKRKHYKVGEVLEFYFAGITVKGEVKEVDKKGTLPKYKVWDGIYLYPVELKDIV